MTSKQSKRDTEEKTVQISIRVAESVRKELKLISVKEDKSLNFLLEEIVTSYLKKYPVKIN
ncbi:MAG: hypothetical protein DHS20C13_13110 [Thermodesulfobacteriota bacterium]|nr:MAG: hypothetical protein DHS20C13_13110 [Thermodesulfobacteriota bacterium]